MNTIKKDSLLYNKLSFYGAVLLYEISIRHKNNIPTSTKTLSYPQILLNVHQYDSGHQSVWP
ncbi:hypothetical protein [Psychrobacter sp. JCM 18901]|uniref:hypothetical protein n=1 Tax=Psychrobacter sp. JCM 18901 TaxID=1298609 RepID=UPI0021C34949|nr:hypothetical protein [Psychrobacter sp. JCM 18901]